MLTSSTNGLIALHRILVKARLHAYESRETAVLATVLDDAELLLTYIISEEDRTDDFTRHLRGLGEAFPEFSGLADAFESGTL